MKPASFFVCLTAVVLALAGCGSTSVPEVPAEPETAAPVDAMLDGDHIATDTGDMIVHPIGHATFVMAWNGQIIYVDPVGGAEAFQDVPPPDLILVTDIHGDHFDQETIEAVAAQDTVIIAPSAVVDQMSEALASEALVLGNDEETALLGIVVRGIPMYNLTEDRLQYHDEGRGNGYVVTLGGRRIYISGDTEDIPEMRGLEDIDAAFVCFNLPYTMTEEQAASAVLEFGPAIVYPYHYRGSDVDEFAGLVGEGGPEVRVLEWY